MCAISDTGRNADIASRVSIGRIAGSSAPLAVSRAPVTTTTSPPSPVAASRIAVCLVRSEKKGSRSPTWRSMRAVNSAPRASVRWNAMISPSPWMVSTACAFRSPSASRAREPSASMRCRARKGLSATTARKGSRAAAIGQPNHPSVPMTTAGTSTATKKGATVWAKKYSTSSTSCVAIATRSPVRRRTRYAGASRSSFS